MRSSHLYTAVGGVGGIEEGAEDVLGRGAGPRWGGEADKLGKGIV